MSSHSAIDSKNLLVGVLVVPEDLIAQGGLVKPTDSEGNSDLNGMCIDTDGF